MTSQIFGFYKTKFLKIYKIQSNFSKHSFNDLSITMEELEEEEGFESVDGDLAIAFKSSNEMSQ